MPLRIFVTGIHTGVGKTFTSANLVTSLRADYWKPIQAGNLAESDSQIVKRLVGPSHPGTIHPERYALKLPASPHLAAEEEGLRIATTDFRLPDTNKHLIVEGAGGCLVPLNEQEDMLDLAKHLDLEVVLVVNPYLGAYNHSLLSIDAIRQRGLCLRGFVLSGKEDRRFADFITKKTGARRLLVGERRFPRPPKPPSPPCPKPPSPFWAGKDRALIWHPFTQHQTERAPLPIERAEGAYLYTSDGRKFFDAISSWWVNLHGHSHPYIAEAVNQQISKMEHVLFAGCTHEPAVSLAERILGYFPQLSKVFYTDNGSTSVEAALKMAFQFWHNTGKPKTRLIAFRNGYHGDTFACMSVSERGGFTTAFSPFLFDVSFIDPPLREHEHGSSLAQLQRLLEDRDDYAAFIFEPLVQGAGGMLMQDAGELDALIALARKHGVFSIADEVMTGFGRTGKPFACHFLKNQPDIVCLSKGLSGGTMPLAMTLCKDFVFDAFLSSDKKKAFLTGHSFTANPVACAAGLASLDLFEREDSRNGRCRIAEEHTRFRQRIEDDPTARTWFKDVRQQGTILALEWKMGGERDYFASLRDRMYDFFLDRDLLLRPLGNILYILPPYCSSAEDLHKVYSAIIQFGRENFFKVSKP